MKKIITILSLITSIGFISTSQAAEHCPEISQIKEISTGIFHADGEKGEWTGVLQGLISQKTPVQSFNMALAVQEDNSSPTKLQYCTYDISHNKTLDMRFSPTNKKDFTIKIEGKVWKQEHASFGLIYNVCENTSPENCEFTVIN